MSTSAPDTAPQALFVLTTTMVSVTGRPGLFSRMSLRTKSDSDGNGPIVSVGVTAQVALLVGGAVVVGGVVVVVVVGVAAVAAVDVGAVGESLPQDADHAAPATV